MAELSNTELQNKASAGLVVLAEDKRCLQEAESLANHLGCSVLTNSVNMPKDGLILHLTPKGSYLADITPTHSIGGKAIRFDCIVL